MCHKIRYKNCAMFKVTQIRVLCGLRHSPLVIYTEDDLFNCKNARMSVEDTNYQLKFIDSNNLTQNFN